LLHGVLLVHHDILQAPPGDASDFAQCRRNLLISGILDPSPQLSQDVIFLVVTGADDKGKSETLLVLRVQILEGGNLARRKRARIQTGRALLSR
jgi:hypothetical protein